MRIYTVHDAAASFFLPPFTAMNDGQAQRMFIASLGDSFAYRVDFTLFCIGDFSDESGEITPMVPVAILHGKSIAEALDPRPRPIMPEAQLRGVA